ncbi:MAG: AAA family ATPase [Opitutaceae bacterium]
MPNAFVIAGPNGAGKTAYARRFLPEEMRLHEFVNADLIAAGLSPFAPEKAAFEAGRMMLRRLRELVAARKDFSFETTLSGRGYAPLLREMRAAGYRVRIEFLWIPELSVTRQRVRQRVAKGGHDIPDEVQQRRFQLGIRNLAQLYRPLVDHWRLFDNTGAHPHLVAEEKQGRLVVADASRLATIERAASVSFMPSSPTDAVEEVSAMTPEEETRRAIRAMRKAFADAVLENLRFGLPVIQWRDGKVVETPAEELAPLARRILAANGEPLPEEG